MKGLKLLYSATIMCCLLFVLAGCDIDDFNANIPLCKVKKITENSGPSGPRISNFTYNGFGNPVKITVTNVGTGNPNRTFKYDNLNRLKEYRGEYANNNYEYWYRYSYDNMNRVAADTVYIFGVIGPEPTTFFDRRVTHYTYDALNRIIKTSTVSSVFPGPALITNYAYDAMGNKILPGGITYDNKVNVHRTNKVWMLIDRDYSVNNPFTADAYNFRGLPTSITLPDEAPLRSFLGFYLNDSDIEYLCN